MLFIFSFEQVASTGVYKQLWMVCTFNTWSSLYGLLVYTFLGTQLLLTHWVWLLNPRSFQLGTPSAGLERAGSQKTFCRCSCKTNSAYNFWRNSLTWICACGHKQNFVKNVGVPIVCKYPGVLRQSLEFREITYSRYKKMLFFKSLNFHYICDHKSKT